MRRSRANRGSKLVHLLENIRSQGGKTLVVGDTPQLIEAATNAGLEAAFVCSGKHSSAFGLSAAPAIDVPANGGHFVEPEEMLNSCRSVFKAALPTFAMSCFSFSAPSPATDHWFLIIELKWVNMLFVRMRALLWFRRDHVKTVERCRLLTRCSR